MAEPDRIQSEVGIRFCRPRCGRAVPPAAFPSTFPTEPCDASSIHMLWCSSPSRKWNAKGGGDPSRRWKSRTAFARVRGRRREWLLHRPGARASPHGRQHHAAGGRRHSSRAAACRGLVAFPAWLSGCSIVTGHCSARQQGRVVSTSSVALAACLLISFSSEVSKRFLGTRCGWAMRVCVCGFSWRLNVFLVYTYGWCGFCDIHRKEGEIFNVSLS